MNARTCRDELLRSGMGCCLFAMGATLVNVLALPFARACHGYPAAPMLAAFALTLAALFALSHACARAGEARCARAVRIALPVFLAVLFAVQVSLGYFMAYTPSGDNRAVVDAARMLAEQGRIDPASDYALYLSRYSNQWGFTLLLSALFRLFARLGIGNDLFALCVLQAALYTLGLLAAADTARRLGGARCVLALLALLALCPPLYLAAAVLYTDTFSLPFILLTLCAALRAQDAETAGGRLFCALCAALAATLGAQVKMTVFIALIAACLVWALRLRPWQGIGLCALAVCVGTVGTLGVQTFMLSRVLEPESVRQHHTPAIHWVMMSIPTADNPYGGFSGDYALTWGMMEQGASREQVMDSIYTRMRDRIYTLRYPNRLVTAVLRKNANAMGDGTFGMTEMLDDNPVRENAVSALVLEGRPGYPAYSAVCTGIYLAVLAMGAAGCLDDIRRRDTATAMLCIALFGMMLFLLLWEARSRYLFGFVPVMLLLAAAHMARRGRDA